MVQESKAEMSANKLRLLFIVLLIVWVLCYNAEQKLPQRSALQVYNRMPDRQITKQQIQQAIKLTQGDNEEKKKDQHESNRLHEKQLCIIVTSIYDANKSPHLTIYPERKRFLDALLKQDYENYKVYYFGAIMEGGQVMHEKDELKVQSQRVRYIPSEEKKSYLESLYLGATTYCKDGSYVIPLKESDVLIGKNVFSTVNENIEEEKFFWSGYLNSKMELGRSYPYPQEIIEEANYVHYPYLPTGLVAFQRELFRSVSQDDLKKQYQKTYYEKATKMAFGLNLLKEAKKRIKYLNEILLWEFEEEFYGPLSPEMKKEVDEIREKMMKKEGK